jgi:RHS repeat-associated protein
MLTLCFNGRCLDPHIPSKSVFAANRSPPQRRRLSKSQFELRIVRQSPFNSRNRQLNEVTKMKLSFRWFVLTIVLAFASPCHGDEPPGNTNPNGNAGDYNGSVTTAGSYDPFTGNANRVIEDIVVPGSVGAYPLGWARRLNTRAVPPTYMAVHALGSGGGWAHSYAWRLVVHHPVEPAPTPPPPPGWEDPHFPHASLNYPDGRSVVWGDIEGDDTFFNPGTLVAADQAPFGMRDRFINCHANIGLCKEGVDYELLMADGGVVKFVKPDPSYPACFATEIVDPYGQVTTLQYLSGRLHKIIEPAGRYLELTYLPYGPDLIGKVEANDGLGHVTQTVVYHYEYYTFYPGYPAYYLTSVDYVDDGTHAYYTYQASNRPPTSTPQQDPHGVVWGLVKTCRDVRFAGPMKNIMYEYRTIVPGQYVGEVGWGQIRQEKNIAGLVLSEVEYPSSTPGMPPNNFWRKEHRPGKNVPGSVSREFHFNLLNLTQTYVTDVSDFLNPANWTHFEITHPSDGTDHFLVTDARGKTTDKQTERGFNATTRVTHPSPGNSYVETIYTDPARPHYAASRRDENGHWTTYTRNTITHEVERIDYPNGSFESFTYNPFKQIEDHTMTNGEVEHFRYARGLKTHYWPPPTPSDTVPGQHKTQYLYYDASNSPGRFDRIDRLRQVIDPLGHTTTYDYNRRGQTIRVTHDDGKFSQSKYNDGDGTLTADGTLAWTADENHPDAWIGGHENERTQYFYDEYKRITDVINPLGETTSTDYTPRNGLSALSHTTSSVYRGTTPGSATHASKVTEYDYDANFRRIIMIRAPGTADEAITSYHYNEVGNLDWVKDPRLHQTTYGYDERNRQTSIKNETLNETTEILYDHVGNKIRETRPDTAARIWNYDVMNRLSYFYDWRLPPGGGGTLNEAEAATATYGRDLAGNILTITDHKGAAYTYEYDKLNRKISLTNPLDANNVSRTETWLYDIAGNLYQYKNPAGQIKEFHYDTRNRQDRCRWLGNLGPDIVTRYDAASRITAILANSGAQAVMRGGVAPDEVIYAETKVIFGYDDANRKIWEDEILDGHTPRRIQTDLNPDGTRRNLQITSPDLGLQTDPLTTAEMPGSGPYFVDYHYTGRNELESITGEDWSFTYSYDISGNMTERLSEYNNGRSSSTSCPTASYDARNRATLWQQASNGQTFAASHYQYDSANREVATWRWEQNNRGERFTYSPNNQLTNVAYNAMGVENGSPTSATRMVAYQYADKLNRMSVTDTPGSGTPVVTNYSTVALNQYGSVGGVTYGYDDNFNLTVAPGLNVSYDAANRVVSASGHHPYTGDDHAEYVYDGLDRCVKQTMNGVVTIFVYDGWKAIAEFDEWNYFQAWNVYGPGPDEILLRYNSQGKYGYVRFQQDRHGNIAFLIDNDGEGIEKYTYDVFGRPAITDWFGNVHTYSYYGHRFLFQGRDYFHELGIYDYRHRFYHPAIGRFLQIDPKGFGAGDMNLFRYVGDDPVDGSDPMGLSDRSYIPEWDVSNHFNVNSFWLGGREAVRWSYGEQKSKMVLVSAHGARGYVMNTNVTEAAFKASKAGQGGIPVPKHMRLDINQLVNDIKSLDNYTATKPVRLDICYAAFGGSASVAQQVANGLKTNQVTANTDIINPNSGTGVGEWRDFNSPESKRPTDVVNKSVRTRHQDSSQPSLGNGESSSNEANRPSARDVDLAHQATGVPSLGAEAVNCAPGRP